jgi:hypothetical protein
MDDACVPVDDCGTCGAPTPFTCFAVDDVPPLGPCPKIACAQDCTAIQDQPTCEATSGCHALFEHVPRCRAGGCGESFFACANGTAVCSPPSGDSCGDDSKGYVCDVGYHLAYDPQGCEAGCVHASLCPEAE